MYDENRPEPSTEPDTPNATRFYGIESDAGYRLDGTESFEQHYTRLANLNTGVFNGKWAVDESERWKTEDLAIYDAMAGHLELTPYQKSAGRVVFDGLSLRELSSPNGIDAPLVAIMVAAVVCRRDGRLYHPNRDDSVNDPLFTKLLDEFGYRESVIHSCYAKVVERTDF